MEKNPKFLKISSAIVKFTAWIFLFLGVVGGLSIIFGIVPGNPRWLGAVVLMIYGFAFFFLFLVAKIADLFANITEKTVKITLKEGI